MHNIMYKKLPARARLQRVRITITMLLAAQMSLQTTVKKGTRYNRAPAGVNYRLAYKILLL